ncbi:hypothetical protein, partial [Fervidicoccus sp.]|uniref:hypothetical protein n=1 Tax=Fervidicoccus sp. TaxID=2060324 RepID=UPI003D0A0B74
YDYEDLVGFYLQSKGYFLMPSTRFQSTKDYEFVAIGKNEKGEREIAVVQCKYYGKNYKGKKIDALDKKYTKLAETYKVYLACNNGVSNIDNVKYPNIKDIKNEELENFCREKEFIIPDRIKFSVAYSLGYNQIQNSH